MILQYSPICESGSNLTFLDFVFAYFFGFCVFFRSVWFEGSCILHGVNYMFHFFILGQCVKGLTAGLAALQAPFQT